jgi:hypothetical protein
VAAFFIMSTRSRRSSTGANVLHLAVPQGPTCIGTIVAWDSRRGPTVEFPGNARGPRLAKTTVPLDADTARAAIESARGVVLLFEDEQRERPIIMGLLHAPGEAKSPIPREVEVDGERVEINGAKEIVLRCGKASIVLRKNGRISIRGVQVESRASTTNRIKGGSVQIN